MRSCQSWSNVLTEFSEHTVMYRSDRLCRDFRLPIVRQQPINLLLDIGQLCVAKSSKELERSNPLHQVAILLEQLFIVFERRVKPVQQIPFLRRNVFRYREEATDFRQHDRLSAISRAACEERLVYPNLRR